MSNPRQIPPELGLLLSMMGLAKKITVNIDPNSPLSEDEQVEAALEKAAAEHRAECEGCRAEYEAEQKAKAQTGETKADELEKSEKALAGTPLDRRQGQVDRRAQGKPTSTEEAFALGAHEAMHAVLGTQQAIRDRIIVGYMAYAGDTPIIGTFSESAKDVDGAINEFTNDIGRSALIVKPVFG